MRLSVAAQALLAPSKSPLERVFAILTPSSVCLLLVIGVILTTVEVISAWVNNPRCEAARLALDFVAETLESTPTWQEQPFQLKSVEGGRCILVYMWPEVKAEECLYGTALLLFCIVNFHRFEGKRLQLAVHLLALLMNFCVVVVGLYISCSAFARGDILAGFIAFLTVVAIAPVALLHCRFIFKSTQTDLPSLPAEALVTQATPTGTDRQTSTVGMACAV